MTLSELIIKTSFNFSVWLIRSCFNTKICDDQHDDLRRMDIGTLGRDIADCLDKHGIKMVPGFESHDLKHVLLDFKMTPLDEIRMQAFMLGNGNYSFACFAILLFGAILLPNSWVLFYRDFLAGRNTQPISNYTIQGYAGMNTLLLRHQIEGKQVQEHFTMYSFVRAAAFVMILSGVFGMCFCLPFLFSSNIADLIGAGFPFLGGAVLTVGGVLTLSQQSTHQYKHVISVGVKVNC
ncbi:hypothetical protein EOD41_08785 [Mucilaginibacter limnophilus]|uniref:Uncharacterized protein n=1 Tax=Mucilaginibacter limnophilus TaxID=1932778 RepID=A0A3S2VP62_9SPHI|nr:hypothetical protein [Mucilaginibacter limnophilus]RVU02035.1 hypothetical protein EOD41_08785 [Mucilaginibacter limnophilus]